MTKYSTEERIRYYTLIATYLRSQSQRVNRRLMTLQAELDREKAAVPRERSAYEEALDDEMFHMMKPILKDK